MIDPTRCFGITDRGRVRKINEDQFLVAELQKSMLIGQTSLMHAPEELTRLYGAPLGKLLVVADGLGGMGSGDQASRIAVKTLTRYVLNTMPWVFRLDQERADDPTEDLVVAVRRCQEKIEVATEEHPERRGMATTLTMAYLLGTHMYVVHVGDSRCYLYREGRLERLTRDHNMAARMVEEGTLAPEEAEKSQWSHVLWNVVGGGVAALEPEVGRADIQQDDVILLCTDGLTKHIDDESIRAFLAQGRTAEETCGALVAAANDAGGSDNITVVVAHHRVPADAKAEPTSAAVTLDASATEVPNLRPVAAQ